MEVLGVFSSPVAKVWFLYCARKVKIGFIATPQISCCRNSCEDHIRAIHTFSLVCWNQLLTKTNLVWAQTKISMQNSPHFYPRPKHVGDTLIDTLTAAMFSGVLNFWEIRVVFCSVQIMLPLFFESTANSFSGLYTFISSLSRSYKFAIFESLYYKASMLTRRHGDD